MAVGVGEGVATGGGGAWIGTGTGTGAGTGLGLGGDGDTGVMVGGLGAVPPASTAAYQGCRPMASTSQSTLFQMTFAARPRPHAQLRGRVSTRRYTCWAALRGTDKTCDPRSGCASGLCSHTIMVFMQ